MARYNRINSPKSRRQRIRERRTTARKRRQRKNIIYGALGIGLLVFSTYSFTGSPKAEPVSDQRLNDNPSKGPEDAPVTLTEFGDFGCPSCKAWHQAGIIDQFLETYSDNLRIVWQDFPIITAYSPKAAEAGQCAYDQDKFWEFHDIAFTNAPALAVSDLKEYAVTANLDVEIFNQCLDSKRHKKTVELDWSEARFLGLRGTPSFMINDRVAVGPNPDIIASMIEESIAAAN